MQRFLSYENTILAVVMMVSFINPFTSSALTTALPGIGTAYGATDAQLSWVIELFLISSTVTIMPISKIADRIGKRHIFLFGVSLFCVSSLAVYFVNSLYGLFLLRILQGLGSASIFATSMAIVSLVTPPQRRGRAYGLYHCRRVLRVIVWAGPGGLFYVLLRLENDFLLHRLHLCPGLADCSQQYDQGRMDRQCKRQSGFTGQPVICSGYDCYYGRLIRNNESSFGQIHLSSRSPLILGILVWRMASKKSGPAGPYLRRQSRLFLFQPGCHAELLCDLRYQLPLIHLFTAHYRT